MGFKVVNYYRKKIHLRRLHRSRTFFPLQVDTIQVLKCKQKNISLVENKDGISLINSVHLKFRSVSYLSISQSLKQILKVSVLVGFLRIFVPKIFCELLSKHLWRSLFLVKLHACGIFWIHWDGCVWSIKIYSYRYSSNIPVAETTKALLQYFRWKYLKNESRKSV